MTRVMTLNRPFTILHERQRRQGDGRGGRLEPRLVGVPHLVNRPDSLDLLI